MKDAGKVPPLQHVDGMCGSGVYHPIWTVCCEKHLASYRLICMLIDAQVANGGGK